jgi:kynureninase
MTKHFAVLVVSLKAAIDVWGALDTQVRQHSPKDSESSGWLLIQLVEGHSRQAFQVLEWTRRRCRHGGDLRDLESLSLWEKRSPR